MSGRALQRRPSRVQIMLFSIIVACETSPATRGCVCNDFAIAVTLCHSVAFKPVAPSRPSRSFFPALVLPGCSSALNRSLKLSGSSTAACSARPMRNEGVSLLGSDESMTYLHAAGLRRMASSQELRTALMVWYLSHSMSCRPSSLSHSTNMRATVLPCAVRCQEIFSLT